MRNDLDTLVSAANAVAQQQGFVHCSVHSYEGRILIFDCEDHLSAERLCGQRQLLGMDAWIENATPTSVFVRQP